MRERALALAGLAQAAELVVRIANHGSADPEPLQASIDSLFRFDAENTEAVFGDASRLGHGLRALVSHMEGGGAHAPAAVRIALTVLQVERKLVQRPELMQTITDGLGEIERQHEHFGPVHATVLGQLGDLYAGSVSQISPRVLVQGNPAHLSQTTVVAQIRAVLLAAIRAAVLWRQLGGSYWDLALRRRAIAESARAWLNRSEP
jgi:high frequency lysogenization protein